MSRSGDKLLEDGLTRGNVHDKYIVQHLLGKGTFGQCFLATRKTDGKAFACKSILKSHLVCLDDVEDIKREIQILHHLRGHPHIVQFEAAFEDPEAFHIVLEYCSGGELLQRITSRGHFSERYAMSIVKQMLLAIAFAHEYQVIHRDLKLENFLFASAAPDSPIKLNDYGLSAFFRPGEVFIDLVGSRFYIAPEVINRHYNERADVWAIGVLAYILLSGIPPWYANSNEETFKKVLAEPLVFNSPTWAKVTDKGKDFITRALNKDPAHRPQAVELLQHPWIMLAGEVPDEHLGESLMDRLRRFSLSNQLRKRALMMVAGNLPHAQIEGLRRIFQQFDRDHNGTITVAELREAMKNKGLELPADEVEELIHCADVDMNGVIDYEEFIAATLHVSRLEEESVLLRTFKQIDADGNGELDFKEVFKCLNECIPNMTEEQAKETIREIDANHDGKVQYEEFVACLKNRPAKIRGGLAGGSSRRLLKTNGAI